MRIEARDGGIPALSATVLADINVRRNLFAPAFLNLSYSVTIPETTTVGSSIVQVLARDQDVRVPHNVTVFNVATDTTNQFARQYFDIDYNTGFVYLRQSLLNDNTNTNRFTVSMADSLVFACFFIICILVLSLIFGVCYLEISSHYSPVNFNFWKE